MKYVCDNDVEGVRSHAGGLGRLLPLGVALVALRSKKATRLYCGASTFLPPAKCAAAPAAPISYLRLGVLFDPGNSVTSTHRRLGLEARKLRSRWHRRGACAPSMLRK